MRAMIDDAANAELWEGNAAAWTALVRQGYDVCRDFLNTPAFLAMLPPVEGLEGLDIGCGEGNNTRLVAARGARLQAVDISPTFIRAAREAEEGAPLGISYLAGSALNLPFAAARFDFVMSTMCFMDVCDTEGALVEAARVLRPGGFLQFSILHPGFVTPRWKWVYEAGQRVGVICGDYFREADGETVAEWSFGNAPAEVRAAHPPFRTPLYFRTLSRWLNGIVAAGLAVEHCVEPHPDEQQAADCPYIADNLIVPNFMILRCRKAGSGARE
jgi:SAM-dependent methyltransferase